MSRRSDKGEKDRMIRKGRIKRYLALLIAGSMVLSTGMVASAEENPGVNIQTGTGQTQNTETEVRTETEQTEEERPQSTEDKTQEDQAQKENGQSGDVQTVHSEEVQAAAEERATPAEELGYVPGEILVSYSTDVSEDEVAQTAEEKDGELIETVDDSGYQNLALVTISDETTVETAVAEYTADPAIAYAEPNYLMESYEESDEAEAAMQATSDDIKSQAEDTGKQWYLDYVKAKDAWKELENVNGEKVKVAVIDTGADINHEDLKQIIDRKLSVELVREEGDTYHTEALRGDGYKNGTGEQNAKSTHGTHVAGIIAAQSGNQLGIQGTGSGGETAKANQIINLVVIDAFSKVNEKTEDSATVGDVVKALSYARETGCKIVNLSLGTQAQSQALEQAVTETYESGVTIVCAAGNDGGTTATYPSDYDTTISVINIDASGAKSDRSNYGSAKDLSAPGTDIYSTYSVNVSGNETSYGYLSGTSMASPIVAAGAAMMLYANPNLTPAQIKSILCSTAVDLGAEGKDDLTGYGCVDLAAAVQVGSGQKIDLSQAEISGLADYSYTGKEITPDPTVKLSGKCLISGTDYTVSYSGNKKPGTATVTITGTGAYTGQATATFQIRDSAKLKYRVHAQSYGWMNWVTGGKSAGTTGESKRLESIRLQIENTGYSGEIQYCTQVQTYGWLDWVKNGAESGTTGQSKRLEAIRIKLTGELAKHYDIYYRVHAQTYGWLDWAKNGEIAGTEWYSKRLEAIEVRLVEKGGTAPGNTTNVYKHPGVRYQTHVQTYGWQGNKFDGDLSGTTGLAKRLEGIKISLPGQDYTGEITYQTHVQTYGWQDWVKNGALAGTTGESKRLEGIRIKLTGEMAEHYDIYYRVHSQTYGWLGWAKNGEEAGTEGLSKRLEAIQIRLVEKGGKAPGSTANAFRTK